MKEVEKVVKPTKDIKTDVESNFEFDFKIELWFDREDCTQEVLLQYPELYPEPRQTVFADVLDRSWDIVEKRSREMSKYDYVFPGWWEFLTSSWAGGSFCSQLHVPRDPINPLLIVVAALTKGNLPELSSQVHVLSVLFDPNLVVHIYNGAMQVLP